MITIATGVCPICWKHQVSKLCLPGSSTMSTFKSFVVACASALTSQLYFLRPSDSIHKCRVPYTLYRSLKTVTEGCAPAATSTLLHRKTLSLEESTCLHFCSCMLVLFVDRSRISALPDRRCPIHCCSLYHT